MATDTKECEQHLSRPGPLVITVRIAHAEPGPGRPADTGPRIDPRVPAVARLLGFDVVLADDARHRALWAWLARDPDGTPLPVLLDRPGDDIWTTQGIPEELAVRLMSAAGGSVTGVEIHPDRADIEEVTELASQSHWQDHTCAVEHGIAVVRSAVPEPAGFAFLGQEVFADDFRGSTVTFRGEFRVQGDTPGRVGKRTR
jgi:hypothetical protein